jgi:hypothetical protein
MIGKTSIQFKSIWKIVIKQSKAKAKQLHGQMEVNNPMPGFLLSVEAGPKKWNKWANGVWYVFKKKTIIGSGTMSPECLPPAIFLVLTPYNVQLIWSFVCTTKLIQRLLHSMNTPQFSHNIQLGWICLEMHGYPGSIRKLNKKTPTTRNMTFGAVEVYCQGKKTWVLHSSTRTLKIIRV